MNEVKFRRIIREEITENNSMLDINLDNRFKAFKSEICDEVESRFNRAIGAVMEEFMSQMKLIAEYTSHMDENLIVLRSIVDNHEHRLGKAGL